MAVTRLLVLGAHGQLGSALLEAAADGDDLDAVGLTREELDLSDRGAIEAGLRGRGFDVLVNCAALTAVDAAETDADSAFAVNAHAVETLARGCRARHARLVHISTDYVFDGQQTRPYRVTDPPGPLNVYGASKLVGETLARRAHPEGTVVLRTSSVFGLAAARGGGGNFVETMLKVGRERERVRVVNDVTMAPTAAADLAEVVVELIRGNAGPGTYHFSNSGSATWYDFARAIFELADLPVEVDGIPSTEYPTPATRPAYSVLDAASTERLLGPAPHWRDALARYLDARGRRQ